MHHSLIDNIRLPKTARPQMLVAQQRRLHPPPNGPSTSAMLPSLRVVAGSSHYRGTTWRLAISTRSAPATLVLPR
ncbi:uncharacterized protein CANTADRAFT_176409 [Suhomyces tanzawaensis NRRL Y-17324]|uniref:Uncharacterized protein n=1 Tax=Suhomyces tanzawaensis NRRL Y-17324 TaxID=984487 RepID=A0A1E4SMT5_9ASCO|nr:uncharacterized protein CANTADRAFT_176409 [Suhomyces tanzawaensis NRRL Y-17324]ODV80831.1 hypothetical protein CANTADRAFT_176409 [Suhomyces tanzawaensis NRRL Y-17324]